MLLKHFCDDEGHIWVGDTRREKVRRTTINSEFVIKHLYTKQSVESKIGVSTSKSYEYENALGKLESSTAPIVEDVIKHVRCGQYPELSENSATTLKEFIFAMARRTPESQERIISTESFENIFYEVAKERADDLNYPLPSKSVLYDDLKIVRLMQLVGRNMFAGFAAGDDDRIRGEVKKFCSETGLAFAVICIPKRNFVIGSHGIGILNVGNNREQSCLTLAHDVCVLPSPFPDRKTLYRLDERADWLIKKINADAAMRSQQIAGRSEALIRSLMRHRATSF